MTKERYAELLNMIPHEAMQDSLLGRRGHHIRGRHGKLNHITCGTCPNPLSALTGVFKENIYGWRL